ncbi:hypothetical protein [uncultured Acetobacteroides sp.]|uniref:toxin-antitoxin system YwqK family antitoxin n=1 Tax=uncultured Acetobacteroides sp. TaxID=1760811 RepID=UPI0029F4F612|nr:hypothetical protein [uncultured Acetobacteroides sp.]
MKRAFYLLFLSALLSCNAPHDSISVNGTKYQVVEGDLSKGIAKCYFDNGILKSTAEISDSTLNGKYVEYYDNGNLKKIWFYKNGKSNGPYRIYFVNGRLFEEGTYKMGVHDKKTTRFNIDGRKVAEEAYNNGDMVGLTEFIEGKPIRYRFNIEVDNDYTNSTSTYHFSISPKPYVAQYNMVKGNKKLLIIGSSIRIKRQAREHFVFLAKGLTNSGILFMLTAEK